MFQRIVAGLLAATALLPATAMAQDRGDRDGRRDRIERRAERPQQRDWQRRDRGDDRRGDRGERGDRGDRGGWNRGDRRENNGGFDRGDPRGDRAGWDRGRFDRGDRYAGQRWNGGWRQDRRYDWARYRSANRGAFRLPRYYAPGGWNYGYRRFGIGTRIAASLFASSYWIADPWAYRLPPAWGPYRWVRYYGDAVLVDVRSGQVVDVIHDIFW
jgi:Ni/Co efflux regulator RcnB